MSGGFRDVTAVPVRLAVYLDRMVKEWQARRCKHHLHCQFRVVKNAQLAIADSCRADQKFYLRFCAEPLKIDLRFDRLT